MKSLKDFNYLLSLDRRYTKTESEIFRMISNTDFKIAVILPVYNTEAYLSQCLDSILRQNYNNFLIYAVDDGRGFSKIRYSPLLNRGSGGLIFSRSHSAV